MLDLRSNKLERPYFTNNTLINPCMLNLSCNLFWTPPSNTPAHLKMVDSSHNLFVKLLQGSLDRLLGLTLFYLHANRFSMLTFGVSDKLTLLSVISLDNKPWACHLSDDISYVLSRTKINLCPCPGLLPPHPICPGSCAPPAGLEDGTLPPTTSRPRQHVPGTGALHAPLT